jgi:catechol 2,3-dioxygenase-like lactoylglutathione lyase family enzyme
MERLTSRDHVLRPVETLDRARDFLRDQLGLTELLVKPGLACFDMGGVPLILRETGQREEAEVLYFGVQNIFEAHELLSAQGVPFLDGPEMTKRHPDGSQEWVAYFTDDEDRTLALHAVMPPKERLN